MADSLKLPPIPVGRGRSPGSSPDVRRRSKEREKQRKLQTEGDHHGLRLPRLFRDRSQVSMSLTNLCEIGVAELSDDGGGDLSPTSGQQSREALRHQEIMKWPVMKTLSAASARQRAQHQHLQQTSASSTPAGGRSPKRGSPQATPTSLTAPVVHKERSHSHSHRLSFPLANLFRRPASSGNDENRTQFENIHDDKGNWIGFVQKTAGPGGHPNQAWDNRNTYLNRARSADDIVTLVIDDI